MNREKISWLTPFITLIIFVIFIVINSIIENIPGYWNHDPILDASSILSSIFFILLLITCIFNTLEDREVNQVIAQACIIGALMLNAIILLDIPFIEGIFLNEPLYIISYVLLILSVLILLLTFIIYRPVRKSKANK